MLPAPPCRACPTKPPMSECPVTGRKQLTRAKSVIRASPLTATIIARLTLIFTSASAASSSRNPGRSVARNVHGRASQVSPGVVGRAQAALPHLLGGIQEKYESVLH